MTIYSPIYMTAINTLINIIIVRYRASFIIGTSVWDYRGFVGDRIHDSTDEVLRVCVDVDEIVCRNRVHRDFVGRVRNYQFIIIFINLII